MDKMLFFPESFLYYLITGSLIVIAISVALLLFLLIKDYKKKNLW